MNRILIGVVLLVACLLVAFVGLAMDGRVGLLIGFEVYAMADWWYHDSSFRDAMFDALDIVYGDS